MSIPFKFLYATLSTPDIERAQNWYIEKLNFEIYDKLDFPDFGTSIVHLYKHDFRLELIQQEGSRPTNVEQGYPPHHTNIQMITQICFMVDYLDQLISELVSKGVEKVWEKRSVGPMGVNFQFFKDCDGRLLQFVELDKEGHKNIKKAINKSGFKFKHEQL